MECFECSAEAADAVVVAGADGWGTVRRLTWSAEAVAAGADGWGTVRRLTWSAEAVVAGADGWGTVRRLTWSAEAVSVVAAGWQGTVGCLVLCVEAAVGGVWGTGWFGRFHGYSWCVGAANCARQIMGWLKTCPHYGRVI